MFPVNEEPKRLREEDMKFVNCAQCGKECLGLSCIQHLNWLIEQRRQAVPVMGGRINDRPYCSVCYTEKRSGE